MQNLSKTLVLALLSAAAFTFVGCADNDMLQGTRRQEIPVSEAPPEVTSLFAKQGATIDRVEEHVHNDRNKYYVVHYTTKDGQQGKLRYNANN